MGQSHSGSTNQDVNGHGRTHVREQKDPPFKMNDELVLIYFLCVKILWLFLSGESYYNATFFCLVTLRGQQVSSVRSLCIMSFITTLSNLTITVPKLTITHSVQPQQVSVLPAARKGFD
jgi:hypothetical protein